MNLTALVTAAVLSGSDNGNSGGSVQDQLDTISGMHDNLLYGMLALIGTSISALVFVIRNNTLAKTAKEEVARVNRAVNNQGSDDIPDETRMFDMVKEMRSDMTEIRENQRRFDSHGWETLPDDLNNAVKLTTTIRDLQSGYAEVKLVNQKVDVIIKELREHVVWEMQVKYHEEHR